MWAWNTSLEKRGERTLIIVRRTLTEPKTALAGVMLDTSFARFTASMATFNDERASSRRFSMVESRGNCKKQCCRQAAGNGPDPDVDGRPSCHGAPRAKSIHGSCINASGLQGRSVLYKFLHVIDSGQPLKDISLNTRPLPKTSRYRVRCPSTGGHRQS